MIKTLILAAVVALSFASVGCGGSKHATALSSVATAVITPEASASATSVVPAVSRTETKVITFVPPASALTSIDGGCWSPSLAVPRANAWRCMSNSEIRDPCFGAVDAKTVICVRDPRQPGQAVGMNLAAPLSDIKPQPVDGKPRPWFILTQSGAVCGFMQGTSGVVNGERVNYACDDGTGLVGVPESGALWTARSVRASYTPPGTTTPETIVPLAVVWL